MTLKVLQGLVGTQGRPTAAQQSSANQKQDPSAAPTANQVQRLVSSVVTTTDAVVSSVKALSKNASGIERLRSYDEAKDISLKVADSISKEEGTEAHAGLDYVSKSTGKHGSLLS